MSQAEPLLLRIRKEIGIRQRCSLSPLLFSNVLELLARILRWTDGRKEEKKKIPRLIRKKQNYIFHRWHNE